MNPQYDWQRLPGTVSAAYASAFRKNWADWRQAESIAQGDGVARDDLKTQTWSLAERIAEMPRFGLALTKKAINQAEDRMGLRDSMDAAFALHHLAHAHNDLTSEDHLAGQNAKTMPKNLK